MPNYTDKFILSAEDRTKAAVASATANFKRLESSTDSLRRGLELLGIGLTLAGAKAFTQSALEMGASISVVAEKAGITAEQLQVLRFAAEQNGSSAEALDKAMLRLNVSIGQAGREALGLEDSVSPAGKAMQALGVSVLDAGGNVRSAGDLFPELIDKLAAIPNPAERAALAAQVFGRKIGPELGKLINQGSAGYAKFKQFLIDSGALMSGELADAADETGDKLAKIGDAVRKNFEIGFLQAFTGEFNSLEEAVTDPQFVESVRQIGEGLGTAFKAIIESAPTVIAHMRELRDIVVVIGAARAGTTLGAAFGAPGAAIGSAVGLAAGAAGVGALRAADAQRDQGRLDAQQAARTRAAIKEARDAAAANQQLIAATNQRVDAEGRALARSDVLRKKETQTLKDELKAQTQAYQQAGRDVEEALRNLEAAKKRVAESQAGAPGARAPNLLSAVNAGNKARASLDAGDPKAAQREAEAALDLIDKLRAADPSANLEIVAKKVQATLRAAAEAQVQQAEQTQAGIDAIIDGIKTKAQILEHLPVGFAEGDAIAAAAALHVALEAELGKPIVVPVVVDSSAVPNAAAPADVPGRAHGGLIPGSSPHSRADNVLIRATAGEWMMQRPSVDYYGAGAMAALNARAVSRDALLAAIYGPARPRGYAFGGLIGAAPRPPAGLGASAPSSVINLTLPGGGTYAMRADPDTASRLQRDVRMQVLKGGKR